MMTRQTHRISLVLGLALLVTAAACGGGDTTGTTAVRVTDVTLGRAIGGDKAITDRTDSFKPNDTIYASITTDGSASNTRLRARWTFEDGQVVDESIQTIAPNIRERTEFHIAKPDGLPAGMYKLQVFLNDQEAQTKDFEVKGS